MFEQFSDAVKSESSDPKARAAVKQAAGGTLIADGLVGLENPFDGKTKRVGIFGAIGLVVFGLLFVGVGFFIRSSTTAGDGDIIVEAEVVDFSVTEPSLRDREDGKGPTYTPIVEYSDAEGNLYRVNSSVRSSSRPAIGSTQDVAYPPENPADGKVLANPLFAWAFIGLGALFAVTGLITFVIRFGSIAFGAKILVDGRKESKALGTDEGVFETLSESASDIYTKTRASAPTQMTTTLPSPKAETSLPPSGWYPDPRNEASMRWFDGAEWTEHVQG